MALSSGKPITPYQRRSKISQIVHNHAAAAEASDYLDDDKPLQQILSCMARKKTRIGEQKNVTLPEDLIHGEILPRLPVKYVLRHRLVCKSWNSLFSTPAFVNSHLTHQLHNSEEKDRIIVKSYGFNDGVNILSHTDSIRVRRVPCACDTLFGSINGLVLMVSTRGRRFCLWNPAIGQVKLFDFPPAHLHLNNECGHYVGGFCWDRVQNDYKALMFCYDSKISAAGQICIYSTSSATWTSLRIPQDLVVPGHDIPAAPSTIVKGIPYWSYSKYLTLPGKKRQRKFFCTFKFVPEINELRVLPDLDSLRFRGNNFNIVNIKDRLVGMTYKLVERGETLVDMYSLDDEESSRGVWSKMYTIGPVYIDSNQRLSPAFRNGGEILIRGHSGPFAIYDPKTKEIKTIAGTTSTFLRELIRQCYSYTPSLVCVRGMESMQNISSKGELIDFGL